PVSDLRGNRRAARHTLLGIEPDAQLQAIGVTRRPLGQLLGKDGGLAEFGKNRTLRFSGHP
ncbi:hypothetical protein MXF29_29090, partial [Pseudomonas sp. NC26]|uniref:hypothetical protein n=1 Tax=Pseudomonas sp. NC26 TaxID=3114535 RepID=UPI002DF0292B|nr:hypothetical protein [Pseudomonas sp. NC26]